MIDKEKIDYLMALVDDLVHGALNPETLRAAIEKFAEDMYIDGSQYTMKYKFTRYLDKVLDKENTK